MNNNNSSNSPIENEEFIKFVGLNPNQVQFIEDMDSNKLLSYINKFNNEIKNGNIESNYIDFIYNIYIMKKQAIIFMMKRNVLFLLVFI